MLTVIGVILLGSGKFFTDTVQAVMYFDGAVQGLTVGSPVNFRGVKVGTVSSIKLQFDRQNLTFRIPVIVEFPKDVQNTMEIMNDGPRRTVQEALAALIERGLRAQLQTASLVTGQLFVQMDFYTGSYIPGQSTAMPDPVTQLLEIPTVPTIFQEVTDTARKALDKLAELPLDEMLHAVEGTLLGINRLVNAPEVMEAIRSLNTTLLDVQQLVRHVDTHLARVATSATTALGGVHKLASEVQHLSQQAQRFVQHADKQVGQLATSGATALGQVGKLAQSVDTQALALSSQLVSTATGALRALEQMRETLTVAQQFVTPNAPVGYELVKALRELSETARSLRVLADYLERHPNAVVFGRKEQAPR